MKNTIIGFTFLLSLIFSHSIHGQRKDIPAFKVLPLGVKGGLDESNLSSYLVAIGGSDDYICLDAGTLHHGIALSIKNHLFQGSIDGVLRKNIKGYCISHAHLDHLSGLILNSPNDTSKYIYALPSVIKVLKDKYFTWQSWANFTNEGDKPSLGKLRYVYLREGVDTVLQNLPMDIKAFSLSHGTAYESTAFLIRHKTNYILYLGDTGSDTVEKSQKLMNLWKEVAPLIKNHQLKAIFLEVSFPDEIPDKSLFGHLTPRLFMKEMDILNSFSNGNLIHTQIFITHMKPCSDCEERIKKQIQAENHLNLNLLYPVQGLIYELY